MPPKDKRVSDADSIYDLPLDTQSLDGYDEDMVTKPSDLCRCQPSIAFESPCDAPTETQQLWKTMQQEANRILPILRNETELQDSIREIQTEVTYCASRDGSEDVWSYVVIWPILQLARKISGLKREVRVAPLQTTRVGSESLLPQLCTTGERINKRIDFGLIIDLDCGQISRVEQLEQSDPVDQTIHGIGPSSSLALKNSPLFCCIEVKKPEHTDNPKVQLGVWTSAVYARWEQFGALQVPPLQNFPTLFGWTIEGHMWTLHLIRRLPNGSRHFTYCRSYDTNSAEDINLIIATMCHLMHQGNTHFRQSFLTSVLGVPNLTPTFPLTLALSKVPAWIQALNKALAWMEAVIFVVGILLILILVIATSLASVQA